MTFKKDYNELLLYLLRELVKNALHFEEIVRGSTSELTHINVKLEDLQSKVMISCYFPIYKVDKYGTYIYDTDAGTGTRNL